MKQFPRTDTTNTAYGRVSFSVLRLPNECKVEVNFLVNAESAPGRSRIIDTLDV